MNKKRYEDRIKQAQQQQEGSNGVAAFVNKRNVNVSMFYDYYERLCRGEQTHVGIPQRRLGYTHRLWHVEPPWDP